MLNVNYYMIIVGYPNQKRPLPDALINKYYYVFTLIYFIYLQKKIYTIYKINCAANTISSLTMHCVYLKINCKRVGCEIHGHTIINY